MRGPPEATPTHDPNHRRQTDERRDACVRARARRYRRKGWTRLGIGQRVGGERHNCEHRGGQAGNRCKRDLFD